MVEDSQSGSIIYIDFDLPVGVEIQKCQPAVVVSNNILAQTSPFIWLVPISYGILMVKITHYMYNWINELEWMGQYM